MGGVGDCEHLSECVEIVEIAMASYRFQIPQRLVQTVNSDAIGEVQEYGPSEAFHQRLLRNVVIL